MQARKTRSYQPSLLVRQRVRHSKRRFPGQGAAKKLSPHLMSAVEGKRGHKGGKWGYDTRTFVVVEIKVFQASRTAYFVTSKASIFKSGKNSTR